ncbi:MAG: accessory factor UbiK family protein [Burkholderiales bacterium]
MSEPKFIDDWAARLRDALRDSPARDLEKNLRAGLTALFGRLELVTREEYDVQVALLARAQKQLVELERRLAALEAAPTPGSDRAARSSGSDGD